jgi:periplasmic protein TonB
LIMNTKEFTRPPAGERLRFELARYCLPQTRRDPDRQLAWVNSICLLFLLIGVVGGKPAATSIKPPPPIEEIIPVVIESLPPLPIRVEAQPNPEPDDQQKSDAPPVVVATPESPAINFSVPTIANVIVPNALATAPPANPMRPIVPVRNNPVTIDNTGKGGERPIPTYPTIAQQLGQQGTVVLTMTVDQNGSITAIEVKQSSGFPMLDRGALEFVKRHWILPAGATGRIFEAPIRFIL